MSLWKKTDSNTSFGKPVYLTDEDKLDTYADDRGWVYRRGGAYTDVHGNVRRKDEILVAIRGLSGNTKGMNEATISAIFFHPSTVNVTNTANLVVVFNEEVTVLGGAPTISVSASNTTANTVVTPVTATYIEGNNTNQLTFSFTTDANAATYTVGGVSISNTQALNIVDTDDVTVPADLTINVEYTGANSTVGTVTAT